VANRVLAALEQLSPSGVIPRMHTGTVLLAN